MLVKLLDSMSPSYLVGMSEEQAIKVIYQKDYKHRIVCRDGVCYISDSDYIYHRYNLYIEDSIVVKCRYDFQMPNRDIVQEDKSYTNDADRDDIRSHLYDIKLFRGKLFLWKILFGFIFWLVFLIRELIPIQVGEVGPSIKLIILILLVLSGGISALLLVAIISTYMVEQKVINRDMEKLEG